MAKHLISTYYFAILTLNLSECVIARETSPCAAEAVAGACHFLGLRPTHACAAVAVNLNEFTRRYPHRMLASLHLDVKPSSFEPFHLEMGKAFSLAKPFATAVSAPSHRMSTESATRPASIVHGDRLGRCSAFRSTQRELTATRSAITPTPGPKSPKVTVSLSSDKSDSLSLTRPQQNSESTRGRNHIPPTVFGLAPFSPPLVVRGSTSPAGENAVPGSESADSHGSSHDGTSSRQTFGKALKDKVWGIAQTFSESPGLLLSLRKSGLSGERIVVLTIEAAMQHSKTAASTKSAAKNVSTLGRFYLDSRPADNITLAGEASVDLLREYPEQAAERGRAASGAVRRSFSGWADALQIDWHLDRSPICAASTAESNTAPRKSPRCPSKPLN